MKLVTYPHAKRLSIPRGIWNESVRNTNQVSTERLRFNSFSIAHRFVSLFLLTTIMNRFVLLLTSLLATHSHAFAPLQQQQRSLTTTTQLSAWQDKLKQGAAVAALATVLATSPAADAAMTGGRIGGSAPAMSRSMPSRSYSRSYSPSYRPSVRPNVVVAPMVTPYSYAPSPFFYRPFNPFYRPVVTPYYQPSFGFGWLPLAAVGLVAANAVANLVQDRSLTQEWDSGLFSAPTTKSQLLSVSLTVPTRRNSILSALDRVSNIADTTTREGLQQAVRSVALELLRRPASITGAVTQDVRDFDRTAVRERAKVEEETLSNFGGRRSGSASGDGKSTEVVVTFVLQGNDLNLPTITDISSVQQALEQVASISDLCQAEILWTPQDASESLTKQDVIADYPDLRAV